MSNLNSILLLLASVLISAQTINASDTLKIVLVSNPGAHKFVANFKPLDTTDDVKHYLLDKTGILTAHQKLFFNGKELEEGYALDAYGIENESTIIQETIKEPGIVLFIASYGKFKYDFSKTFQPTDLVEDVKEFVTSKTYIPKEKQELIFNAREIEDGYTLESYGIKDESVIVLQSVKEPSVLLDISTPHGYEFTYKFKPTDLVETIKELIESRTRIPKRQQELLYDGRPIQDDRTIGSYGFQDGAIIVQQSIREPSVSLWIKTSYALEFTHQFKPTDLVEMIKELIESKTSIPKRRQELLYNGRPIQDGRTIGSYGLQDGAIIVQQKTL